MSEWYQAEDVNTERGNNVYINEVLRACDTLCPNEYSDNEKYRWCDELSAMLTQEYLKKYNKVTVEAEQDGSYLLPEGVTFEMVDRIIDGAREIDKRDFRSYDIKYYYGRFGRFVLPVRNRVRGSIDVVYLKKHEPIRNVDINDTVQFFRGDEPGFLVKTTQLQKGDNVTIKTDNHTFENIPILETVQTSGPLIELFALDKASDRGMADLDEGGEYCFAEVPKNTFDELFAAEALNVSVGLEADVHRILTDETVCDAPYDRMYIDYVNAQICYYQRDFDTYNQHMNLFNQRLMAYQAWLQQRRVQDKDGKIVNWW